MDFCNKIAVAVLIALLICETSSVESKDGRMEYDGKGFGRQKRAISAGTAFAGIGGVGTVALAGISIAGLVMSHKQAEAAARRHDETMRAHRTQLCMSICVTEWTPWSACSHRCGGGTTTRTRDEQTIGMCNELQDLDCPFNTEEEGPCNEECPNAGIAEAPGNCTCPPQWTGQCCQIELTCEHPGAPENGQVSGTWPAKYQSVATFSCNPGFTLRGESQSVCNALGRWTKPTPRCANIICTRPTVHSPVRILNEGEEFYVGDELVYSCDEGHRLEGSRERQCRPGRNATGRWSGVNPECKRITCGDPGIPLNGERIGEGIHFNDVLRFSCNEGYRLVGTESLKCRESGHWFGSFPQCEAIVCEEPWELENGVMRLRSPAFGAVATFQCNEGYRLEGSQEIECIGDGVWSAEEPSCQPADCGPPMDIQNGAKDGSIYFFPHSVTFSCFHGYVLVGEPVIECLENGGWSSVPPSCEPCAVGHFMSELEPGVCQRCPEYSSTTTPASTSHEQCICDEGYDGPPGGPCVEIQCPVLDDPDHGSIQGECQNTLNQQCQFVCEDGYFISRGSSVRTCQSNGEWDGVNTICTACGKNTYKNSEQSCLPCPTHSHTLHQASMREDCICDDGYTAAENGSCEDVDECSTNGGRGPCSDLCINNDGGYTCDCSIPGYAITSNDSHTCAIEDQCRNLTQADAPEDGGLICHWYVRENSQQCTVRCNPGYEFPSRTNDYETCGPSTNYTWTFETAYATPVIGQCLVEFFPEFTLEAKSAYFVRACDELTQEEKEDIYREFAIKLQDKGICVKNERQVCNIDHMNLICGVRSNGSDEYDYDGGSDDYDYNGRYRRDVNDPSADLGFGVKALKSEHKITDCPQICRFLRIRRRYCTQLCVPSYKRFLKASVLYAKRQLEIIYNSDEYMENLELRTANRTLTPVRGGLHTGDVVGICPDGMGVVGDNCATCEEGTFVNATSGRCNHCPVGTYQPLIGQSVCIPCPLGTTTSVIGSRICQVCPPSRFGEQCLETCDCVNGSCDPRDGTCQCHSGWEGPLCDRDVNGCQEGFCGRGMTCLDISAPGTGFQCVT